MKRTTTLLLAGASILLFSIGAAFGQSSPTKAAALSSADLASRVQALKQEQVAWRKVDWRTCLIQGLKESRLQRKPILLWVFIDRPIDDERC